MVNSWNSSELYEIPCATKETEDGSVELLLQSSDYEWKLQRTSFSVDFDLFCDFGHRRDAKTMISSIYFLGALSGLLTGTFMFDNLGRKTSAIIGNVILVPVTFLGTFCYDYYLLLFIRFFQGFGGFVISTSMFILVQELLPSRIRNNANCFFQVSWALGYPIAAGVGYFITDWNYMFFAASIIVFFFDLSVFFCAESPRYYLMKNNEVAAKKSFKFLSSLTDVSLDLDNIIITDTHKTKERRQTYFQQMKDLVSYPYLAVETSLQMFLWFVSALCYYGINFGWASIIPDIYLGYVMSAGGSFIAYVGMVPLISWLGRRRAMILVYAGAACCFLIAIPDLKLDSEGMWTLESVASLVAIVFVSASFSGMYLWSGELAPTSHRGLVFGASSCAARLGSFLGPFIFLSPVIPKQAQFGGLAGLVLICSFLAFLLVETCDKEIPVTGEDVQNRRRGL